MKITEKYSDNFELYISKTIEFETGGDKSGAYHSDPDDKGGETKWGISKRYNKEYNIKTLRYQDAKKIYYEKYYNPYYDSIKDKQIGFKVFDMGVLMGSVRPLKALQGALKKLLKLTIAVDGRVGPITIAALSTADKNQTIILRKLLRKKIQNQLYISALNPGNWKFYKGWQKRNNYEFEH